MGIIPATALLWESAMTPHLQAPRNVSENCGQLLARDFVRCLAIMSSAKSVSAGGRGGLRFKSWERLAPRLQIEPFWTLDLGNYLLLGITSTLVAFPTYEPEGLPEERDQWLELRREHLERIRETLSRLHPGQRVLLFCHDPTALPYLAAEPLIAPHLQRIERTVIGHLHTPLVLRQSQFVRGHSAN